jgi:hypothetical protein
VYDEETGKRKEDRNGNPIPRVKGTFAPCRYPDPKQPEGRCPKGTPETSLALTERNRKAWEHYLECKAVGRFPDDPIVRRNAGLIRQIEDRMADNTRRLLELVLKYR